MSRARHTGFVVRQLDKAVAFYQDILGLTIINRATETGDYISKLVGLENATVEWVKLADENGFLVELLQYHSHPFKDAAPFDQVNRVGCNHMAFTIKDAHATHRKLTQNGFKCISDVLRSPDGNVNVFYCYDPDGSCLELVEELTK
jgi:catechol 2,3-dioxygenase-like lactoylglutathione lyase family enzyme